MRGRLTALAATLLLAGCPSLGLPQPGQPGNAEKLAQACQYYAGVISIIKLIPHPYLQTALPIIQSYVDPICKGTAQPDANSAAWVRSNTSELQEDVQEQK